MTGAGMQAPHQAFHEDVRRWPCAAGGKPLYRRTMSMLATIALRRRRSTGSARA
jgi:hypothetical protein